MTLTTRQKRLLGFGAVAFLICIIVVFGSLAWSTNYNYCVSHKGEHATGQYNQEGSPIIEPKLSGEPGGFSLFVYCGGIFTDQNASAITALATLFLMGITGGLVVLGWFQYSTTRSQLRAYVAVEAVGMGDGAPTFANWVKGSFSLKNSGQTPARNVRHWIRIDVGTVTSPALLPAKAGDTPPTNIPSGGVVQNNEFWMGRQLTAAEIAAIQARTQAIYVYGVIEYEDIFRRDRETLYRLSHTGSWPPAVNTILMFCPEGNSFT